MFELKIALCQRERVFHNVVPLYAIELRIMTFKGRHVELVTSAQRINSVIWRLSGRWDRKGDTFDLILYISLINGNLKLWKRVFHLDSERTVSEGMSFGK